MARHGEARRGMAWQGRAWRGMGYMTEYRLLARVRMEYEYGIHSGIPRCCVLAWCRRVLHGGALPDVPGVGYRPCPSCSARLAAGERAAPLLLCDTYPGRGYPWLACGCGRDGNYWWGQRLGELVTFYLGARGCRVPGNLIN